MAYPTTPLTVVIEFWDGTQWVDITSDVYARGKFITIRRGFPDEGSSPEPGSCAMELRNVKYQADGVTVDWAGRYSPRNPSSIYYGLIGRNTPVRVTVNESFVASGDQVRYTGEISEWPTRWDVSGRDVWVDVAAQGILRRLGQGKSPLHSALRRAIETGPTVSAYWALGDGPIAEAALLTAGTGGPFQSADWFDQIEPGVREAAPWLGPGLLLYGSGAVAATINLPAAPTRLTIDGTYLWEWVESNTVTQTASIALTTLSSLSGSDNPRWVVQLAHHTDGSFETTAGYAGASLFLDTSATDDVGADGPHHLRLDMVQNGANVDYEARLDGVVIANGTATSITLTPYVFARLSHVDTGGDSAGQITWTDVVVYADTTPPAVADMTSAAVSGNSGETAADRADRLTTEQDLSFALVGTAGDTMAMGPQYLVPFIESYNETWAADLALAYETRGELGLSWRTRKDLYNQDPVVELDYEGGGEIAGLDPTDDDRHVRNDIEVRRKNGSVSPRATDTTSRMGTQSPPDGVGQYEHSVELNVSTDLVLFDIASWLLHLGTWDEARYPTVRIDMAALAAAGETALMAAVAALDVGDRVRITNLPVWASVNSVDLMVLGFQETIGHPIEWTIVLICVPYGPFVIAVAEDPADPGETRIGSDGSTVNTDFDSGVDTSLSVAVAAGYDLWQTGSVDYDIRASGARLHVTNISGASSPQTFTVDATPVNGVEKTIPAGAAVELAELSYYGL